MSKGSLNTCKVHKSVWRLGKHLVPRPVQPRFLIQLRSQRWPCYHWKTEAAPFALLVQSEGCAIPDFLAAEQPGSPPSREGHLTSPVLASRERALIRLADRAAAGASTERLGFRPTPCPRSCANRCAVGIRDGARLHFTVWVPPTKKVCLLSSNVNFYFFYFPFLKEC